MVRRLASYFVHRLTGYDVVRVALAVLLLAAAGLKAHSLATEPVLATGLLDSRWVLIVAVEFELLFALWLSANISPKPTWAAALACFGLFTCISVYKALSGETTCGCFGSAVNPWWTATLDLAIVFCLFYCRPAHQASLSSPEFQKRMGVSRDRRFRSLVFTRSSRRDYDDKLRGHHSFRCRGDRRRRKDRRFEAREVGRQTTTGGETHRHRPRAQPRSVDRALRPRRLFGLSRSRSGVRGAGPGAFSA